MELKIEHLSKQFKDKTAVNDVNLTLTPGVWGLLGANGAGKTTLMRMIADIMTPTSGAVYYDGKNIRELGEVYRSKFGFLPQDFGYHRDFTVKDYLEYIAALKDIPTRAIYTHMQSEAHVPWFRVVFEMTDGSLMEFQMQQGDFRELEKGDRGMLTYQGNRYICYQKYKFKSEAQEEEKC